MDVNSPALVPLLNLIGYGVLGILAAFGLAYGKRKPVEQPAPSPLTPTLQVLGGAMASRGQTDIIVQALNAVAEGMKQPGVAAALDRLAEPIQTIADLMVRQHEEAQEKERDRLEAENVDLKRRVAHFESGSDRPGTR